MWRILFKERYFLRQEDEWEAIQERTYVEDVEDFTPTDEEICFFEGSHESETDECKITVEVLAWSQFKKGA